MMTSFSHVHLLFCEGPHDAAFLSLMFKRLLGFKRVHLKISEIPYPFSNIFRQSMLTHSAEDLRLDLAKKFFLPDFLLEKDGILVMIFNSGGSTRRAESIGVFLKDVFELLEVQESFSDSSDGVGPEIKFAIFADADSVGTSKVVEQIQRDLAVVGAREWLSENWAPFHGTRAVSQATPKGQVSAYIWRQWRDDIGTLEDVALECLDFGESINQTFEFLDQRFSWAPEDKAKPIHVCALAAKRLKAALCIEGQREKPGGSLSVVLDQANLISGESLVKSQSVQDCVSFLRQWVAIV